jgi:DNA repair protein RadC
MYELRIVHKKDNKISGEDQKEVYIKKTKDVLPVVKEMAEHTQEHAIIITLDTNLKMINARITHIGIYNESCCSTKEVLKWAVMDEATGVIFVHNHPSGNIKPTKTDKRFIKKLIKACNVLDMVLLDSVIVHDGDCRSMFTRHGRLK